MSCQPGCFTRLCEYHYAHISTSLKSNLGSSIWICKLAISEFLKRLNFGQSWKKSYQIGLETLRWFLGATFIAVVISIFAECRPANHLWQVLPDPGPQCRQAYANLLTVSILDALTDLALVLFPITIVLQSKMPNLRYVLEQRYSMHEHVTNLF